VYILEGICSLKCVLQSSIGVALNRSPLCTVTSRNTASVLEMSKVNFIE